VADDFLSAALEEIRADITGIRHPDAEFIAHSRHDVSRLLAAVDKALELAVDWETGAAELDRDVTVSRRSPYAGDHRLADTDAEIAKTLREHAAELRAAILAALTGEGKAGG
jgi:hypothetical protein